MGGRLIESSEIFFPVLHGADSQVTKTFGIENTPLKLLINNKVQITPSEQDESIEKLDKILK